MYTSVKCFYGTGCDIKQTWHEGLSGRAGNDIASTVQLLSKFEQQNSIVTHIILQSDPCAPQNRNSQK